MTDYAFASAKELVAAIKNKEISSLELTDLYIERIEKFDSEINAVVVHDFERGREAAIDMSAQLAHYSVQEQSPLRAYQAPSFQPDLRAMDCQSVSRRLVQNTRTTRR